MRDSSDVTAERAVVRVGVIATIVVITYALPFMGLLMSLGLPAVTHASRRYLWPSATPRMSLFLSVLAWAGLWLPALLDFFTSLFSAAGIEISTRWLIIPLCAPDGIKAVLLPALAAAGVCLLGLAAAVASRSPWLWVVAACLAPWAHQAAFTLIPHEFVC